MKKLKKIVWVLVALALILIAFKWFIPSPKNTLGDGVSVAVTVMYLTFLFGSSTNEILKKVLKAVVGLFLVVSCGAFRNHSFYGGFGAGIVLCVAVYFLWPFLNDLVENCRKTREARNTLAQRAAKAEAAEARMKDVRARWRLETTPKENRAKH